MDIKERRHMEDLIYTFLLISAYHAMDQKSNNIGMLQLICLRSKMEYVRDIKQFRILDLTPHSS